MKTALLIVDLHNDFLPGGALAAPGGDEIVALGRIEVVRRIEPRTTDTP